MSEGKRAGSLRRILFYWNFALLTQPVSLPNMIAGALASVPTLPQRGQFSSGATVLTATTQGLQSSQTASHAAEQHHVFTGSGIAVKKTTPNPIYKWETGSSAKRTDVVVDGRTFEPSNCPAIYTAKDSGAAAEDDSGAPSQQFVDFQCVLTKEEMEALAARRKKLLSTATANVMNTSAVNCSDKTAHKNHAASMSMQASTPYIDSKRIQKELFTRR